METTNYQLTKADRNRISRGRTQHLQRTLSDLLLLTFDQAVEFLEFTALHNPDRLAKTFQSVFQTYTWAGMVVEILAEGRRAIADGLDYRYYDKSEKDLYLCLSPETQEKLRLQNIFY
jgi:hypothetical protein